MRLRRGTLIVLLTLALLFALAGGAWAAGFIPSTDSDAEAESEAVDLPASFYSNGSNLAGLAPDDNPPAISGTGELNQSFSYYFVSGATLRGRTSTTGYAYSGLGCVYTTSGTGIGNILNTELFIPPGSEIKYLRLYYYDTIATENVGGYITRYQPGMATTDLISTSSTTSFAGGYGFVVSYELSEIVNGSSFAYTLIGWPSANNSGLQICGLRVAYYAPSIFATFLPAIVR